MTQNLISLLGMFAMIGIAWLFSRHKSKVNWKTVGWGIGLQFAFALLVLRFPPGRRFFQWMNDVITGLLSYSDEGASFVFGGPFRDHFFAFSVLPTIIFVSSVMAVLYYLNVMQKVVYLFAVVMAKFMGTSGAESLSASANIFVGQTEAPLLVRPYVERMTISELFCVMTGGMATVAGGVMAAYVGFLRESFPNIAGHLLTASILSAPAALVMAKIIIPETGEPVTRGTVKMNVEIPDANVIDAAARGAGEGLTLALNVGAMLIAFIALISLINSGLTWVGDAAQSLAGRDSYVVVSPTLAARVPAGIDGKRVALVLPAAKGTVECVVVSADAASGRIVVKNRVEEPLPAGASVVLTVDGAPVATAADATANLATKITFELLSGLIFWPLAFLMGVPAADCLNIGKLLGEKVVLNEFVAYLDLTRMIKEGMLTDPRSVVIATYALCGFSNFSSIAIQIGGIGGIAPSRRHDLAKVGLLSVVSGSLACFMTANVAGTLYNGETVLLGKHAGLGARPAAARVVAEAPSAAALRTVTP